jgi:hypothetical protein
MKSLPFWLRLMLACIMVGGLQFGFQLWENEPMERAIGNALLQTFAWGFLMYQADKYGLFKRNQK